MKSILLSIKPEWLAKILNREKTIEIRKLFPKDYVGWVYLYCSKNGTLIYRSDKKWFVKDKNFQYDMRFNHYAGFKGKVVARFWCNRVEEIYWKQDTSNPYINDNYELVTNSLKSFELLNQSCLNETELIDYLDKDCEGWNVGFAIHISKLEIFDRPRELSEFYRQTKHETEIVNEGGWYIEPLTKAPQNYCYIEEE